MSEVERIESLKNGGWLEYYSDGRVRAKNPEGKLMKHPNNYTPSKAASDMGKVGARKLHDISETAESLLDELGLSGPFHEQLAKVLIKGGSGAVGAAKELIKSSKERGNFRDAISFMKLRPDVGEICSTCHEIVFNMPVSEIGSQWLKKFIEVNREGLIAEGKGQLPAEYDPDLFYISSRGDIKSRLNGLVVALKDGDGYKRLRGNPTRSSETSKEKTKDDLVDGEQR